jgi:hypothetical protein
LQQDVEVAPVGNPIVAGLHSSRTTRPHKRTSNNHVLEGLTHTCGSNLARINQIASTADGDTEEPVRPSGGYNCAVWTKPQPNCCSSGRLDTQWPAHGRGSATAQRHCLAPFWQTPATLGMGMSIFEKATFRFIDRIQTSHTNWQSLLCPQLQPRLLVPLQAVWAPRWSIVEREGGVLGYSDP